MEFNIQILQLTRPAIHVQLLGTDTVARIIEIVSNRDGIPQDTLRVVYNRRPCHPTDQIGNIIQFGDNRFYVFLNTGGMAQNRPPAPTINNASQFPVNSNPFGMPGAPAAANNAGFFRIAQNAPPAPPVLPNVPAAPAPAPARQQPARQQPARQQPPPRQQPPRQQRVTSLHPIQGVTVIGSQQRPRAVPIGRFRDAQVRISQSPTILGFDDILQQPNFILRITDINRGLTSLRRQITQLPLVQAIPVAQTSPDIIEVLLQRPIRVWWGYGQYGGGSDSTNRIFLHRDHTISRDARIPNSTYSTWEAFKSDE